MLIGLILLTQTRNQPHYYRNMFADYKKLVTASYQAMKGKKQLSSALENPSPGKLKRCCEDMLRKGLEKRDEVILKDFFNPKNEYNSLEESINRYDSDKLKPLINLMKGEIEESYNDDNYKLLAVLLGFEPRPYRFEGISAELPFTPTSPELKLPKSDTRLKIDRPNSEDVGDKDQKETKFKQLIHNKSILYGIAILALIISASSIYFSSKSYMIWRIDRFRAIDKTALVGDTILVALDKYRLEKFRKIMTIDTVTAYSIGRLWYLKTDNKVELFTTGGKHPIHTERQLKILSQDIYDKYLRKNGQTE